MAGKGGKGGEESIMARREGMRGCYSEGRGDERRREFFLLPFVYCTLVGLVL